MKRLIIAATVLLSASLVGAADDSVTFIGHEQAAKGGSLVTAGDVMVIPAGVPHWFKEVPSSIDYYVVKVIAP